MGFYAPRAAIASRLRDILRRFELLTQRTALAMLTSKRFAAELRDNPPETTASTTRCEDLGKRHARRLPSARNHESDFSRFGNPIDSNRSEPL